MGTIDLNFGKVGQLPPEGDTLLNITKCELKAAKDASKAPNLEVTFQIAEHDDLQWVNYEFKQWLNLGDKSLWKVQEFLEAATGSEWKSDEMALDPDDVINQQVLATLVEDTDQNDRPVIKVKTYLRP